MNSAADRFERRLTEEMSALRVEIIKWSFLFWLGQVAVIVSVLAFMLRDR